MHHRFIIALFAGLVCFSVSAQQKEQRVALVIGNSSYKSSPLKNPVNDARDMASSLRGYGFTVIERSNLTTRQVGQTLREFRSKLTPGAVAVVFYAGHGVQIKGENYLPTVDAEINGEEDVPLQSLSTRQVMDVLAEAKTRMNLVFLDACRDNPYARSFRSGSRGIAKENAPSGTLISFATRPGSVAADGDGRNGLYTSVLLEQIKQSNQPIEQVLKRVVSGVKVASKGQQEPWMEGSIEGDFCFSRCNTPSVESAADPDNDAWSIAKRSNTIAAYDSYLREYPLGRFAGSARVARAVLVDQNTAITKPSSGLPSTGDRKISIKAPDVIENGQVVPVFYKFDPPIKSGEIVELLHNGTPFITVSVTKGALLGFSTRLRMPASGSLGGRCAQCQRVDIYVPVKLGGGWIENNPSFVEKIQMRLQGGTLRTLITADSYIGSSVTIDSDSFRADLRATKYLSPNPFFQFDADQMGANVCMTYKVGESTKKECASQNPVQMTSQPQEITDSSSAARATGPSDSYGGRLRARIKPNITFADDVLGNPAAEVEVRCAPDGTIVSRKLVKSSGNSAWDKAVLSAIDHTEVLPRDTDGRVPSPILISFRPKD